MRFDWSKFIHFENMLLPLWETVYMVVIATVIAIIIGLPIGIALITAEKDGLKPNRRCIKY